MKNIKNASFAILFCLAVCACNGQQSSASQITGFDPVEYGKAFDAVCKVGLKGGDGTLIEKNWVITAGHVASGMYRRTGGNLSVYFNDGREYKVKQVFLHPEFQPMGKYDIALLQLETDVTGIKPFKINREENELNQIIFLAGHGDKRNTDGSWIKDGKLRAYTNQVDEVNNTHIIFDYDSPEGNATDKEGTSGPGDSGGPALLKRGGEYFVAGISSMGEPGKNGPATYGAIEHFVRVSKFKNWIDETMLKPESTKAYKGGDGQEKSIDQSKGTILKSSARADAAMQIVNTFGSYSEEMMLKAIAENYSPNILKMRQPEQIIKNMPFLIKELQQAQLDKVIEETASKISFKLKKGDAFYMLDIYFAQGSDKIEQMAFGKLN